VAVNHGGEPNIGTGGPGGPGGFGGRDKSPRPPPNVFRAAVVQRIISLASLDLRTMSRLPSLLQTRPGSIESPET
jgi:hypothetical protein